MMSTLHASVGVLSISALYFLFGPRKLFFQLCHDLKLLSTVSVPETLYIEAMSDNFYQAIFYQLNTYQLVNHCQPNLLVSVVPSFFKKISLSNDSWIGNLTVDDNLGLKGPFDYKQSNLLGLEVILGFCVLAIVLFNYRSVQMMAINYYPYIRNFFLDDGSDIDSSNDDNNNNNNNSRGGNDGNSSSRNHINIDEKGYSSNFIYAHHRKHLPANYKRQPSKSTQKATTYAAYENSFNNLNRAKDDFRTILTTYQGMINHLTKNYVSIDNEAPDNNGRAPGTVTEQFVASQNELIEGIRGVRIAKEGNAKTLQALIQRLKGSTTTSDVGSSKSSLILPADISISENEPSYARLSSSPPMDNTFSGNVSSNADPGPPTPVKICTLKRDAFTVESTLAASSMDNAAPKDDLSVQPAKPAPVTSPISPKNCNSTGKVSSNIPEANSTFVATFANNSFGHYSTCCPVPFRDPGGPSKPPIYPIKTSVYNGALDSDSEYEYSEIEEQYEGKGKGRATVPQWTKRKKVKAAKELLLTTAIGGCGIKFYPNS